MIYTYADHMYVDFTLHHCCKQCGMFYSYGALGKHVKVSHPELYNIAYDTSTKQVNHTNITSRPREVVPEPWCTNYVGWRFEEETPIKRAGSKVTC